MKKITLLAALACLPFINASAQSACNNQDFEDSTFTNWTGATGTNSGLTVPNSTWVNGIVTTGPNAAAGNTLNRMTIITQNSVDSIAIDPITSLPDTQMTTLAPGGGFASVRLGNRNIGAECEKLTYQYTVTSNNTWFQFQFATVMEDPGHPWSEQPYFMVNFFDQSMNIIAAASDTIWSADPSYPFIPSMSPWNTPIQYRHWTPVSVDMSAYIGQNITVEFVNSDCSYSGHFGYTYLDVSCFGAGIPNVWPGDCDYDLQANVMDVLPYALAFGSTGTPRAGASNNWVAQPSADWTQSFAFGMNYKHSDCNGDGIVDLNDTTALIQNYGLTHVFRTGAPVADVIASSTNPPLKLVPVASTVGPFNYVDIDVYAGDNTYPVERLYGVAYTINYNNALVQPGTFSWNFSGSGLGVRNSSMVALTGSSSPQDQEAGQCRMAPGEMSGAVYLGRIHFAVDNVTTSTALTLNVRNVKAINSDDVIIPMTPVGCTITIDPALPANVQQNANDMHVNLFPNPANTNVTISSSVNATRIEITDAAGRSIYTVQPNSQQTQIDVSGFAKGMYFVNVYSENGKSAQQLVIAE